MLTKDLIKKNLEDLEQKYGEFIVNNFSSWQVWADLSKRMLDGEMVMEDEVPSGFLPEYKWARVVMEMEKRGKFDWNDPMVSNLFEESAQAPFYKLWGEIITSIALRLADMGGVKTFIETGAGRANLTSIMLKKMKENDVSIPLITTDAHAVVLENIDKLKTTYPQLNMQTSIWDISEAPSNEFQKEVKAPALLYERATINYANFDAIKNFSEVADILVLGDYLNKGKVFAYDEIFKKIGAEPLFYKDIKNVLDEFFPNQYVFDEKAVESINLPNITMLIAWK